jgi:hypothetical protein
MTTARAACLAAQNVVDIARIHRPPFASAPSVAVQAYPTMPSLFRLLVFLGLMGGLAYGTVFSLANFVALHPREIVVTIPPSKFFKQP